MYKVHLMPFEKKSSSTYLRPAIRSQKKIVWSKLNWRSKHCRALPDKIHTKKSTYDCLFFMTELQTACVYKQDCGSSCVVFRPVAHDICIISSSRISIGCVNNVHPPLVCPVCESGGMGCPRERACVHGRGGWTGGGGGGGAQYLALFV